MHLSVFMCKERALMYNNIVKISVAFELKVDGSHYFRTSHSCSVIAITKFKIKDPK